MKRFQRSARSRVMTERTDDTLPIIRVQVAALDPHKRGSYLVKGNICKSLTIRDAKVSEVFAAIEKALFGGK